MKILIFIFFFVQLLNISSSQLSVPAELEQARILTNNVDDPCTVSSIITCVKQWDSKVYVKSIKLTNCQYEVDYTVFKYLESLEFGIGAIPSSNFYSYQINKIAAESLVLYIDENNTIPETTSFSSFSIKYLAFPNFYGTFKSSFYPGNLQTLIIDNAVNFEIELPSIPLTSLTLLTMPMPQSGLPSGFDSYFYNIYRFNLLLGDLKAPATYSSEIFGKFNFASLVNLNISQSPSGLNNLYSFPDVSKLVKLSLLSISGSLFKIESNQVIELRNSQEGLSFTLENGGNMFVDCNDCLKLPNNNIIKIIKSNLNFDSLDLSNSSSISFDSITPQQTVTFNNINFNKLNQITLLNNQFAGDLVEDICSIPIDNIQIRYNLFSGAPSCFYCTGNAEIRNHIIPNSFQNFDENTPISCDNFKVDDGPISFTGSSRGFPIIISGQDLGFDAVTTPSYITYEWMVSNKKLAIQIPPASSSNTNNNIVMVDLVSSTKHLQYSYSYYPPTIGAYSFEEDFSLIGSNFSYVDVNGVLINGKSYKGTTSEDDRILLVQDINPATDLEEGKQFTVQVTSNGMQSNIQKFVFYSKPISIDSYSEEVYILPFNDIGGTANFNGSFLTSDKSGVQVIVCGLKTDIKSVSSSSLSFKYPIFAPMQECLMEIYIFGKYFSTDIQIVHQDIQESSSSSGSNSTSSDNSDPSSEDVSYSFKLNISSSFIILLIISSIILI